MLFFSLFFPGFWKGFLSFLFFILIISSAFYFQKNRYLLKAVGISFLILVLFILSDKFFYEKNREELAKKGEEVIREVQSLKEKAIKTGNPELCERIKEINKTLDPRIKDVCTDLREGDILYDYYVPCIAEVAIKTGDENLCNKEKGVIRDLCFEWAAEKTKNRDFCKKIKNKYIREECYKKTQ